LANLLEEYRKVRRELEMWDEALVKKHRIIAVNKSDVEGVEARFEAARDALEREADQVICMSAAGHTGLPDLLDGAVGLLAQAREEEAVSAREGNATEDVPVIRPGRARKRSLVAKRGEEFIVSSKAATRLAAMVNESDWAARMEFYGHLERLGVIKELEQAGVKSGDVVKIGDLEWEWE
jgi:GTP-binding protein